MVHSIAISGDSIFACQGTQLVKFSANKQAEKSINDADLTQIKATDKYVVGTVNNTKQVRVYDSKTLEIVATHEFPKRPSAFNVSSDSADLVVADKFGDVFHTKLLEPVTDIKSLQPISGHVSMVLDVVLPPKHIIASDRDEHIRVSRFPQSFVIENFLLGHKSFVSHLAVQDEYLISGGGDPHVFLWNWQTGELLGQLDIGKPVIALAISESTVYVLPEQSETIIRAKLPSLEKEEAISTEEPATCLAVRADGEVYVGLSNRIDGFPELEGSSDAVSEEYLRKINKAV